MLKKNFLQFPKALVVTALIFILLLISLYFLVGRVSDKDHLSYQKLMNSQESDLLKNNSSSQIRKGLQKDIIFNKNDQEHHFSLKSAETKLVLDKHEGKTSIVEHMQEIECLLKEKCVTTSNTIEKEETLTKNYPLLLMKAKKGIHHYEDQIFKGEEVTLFRYSIPCNIQESDLDETYLVAKGTAASITLILDKDVFNFKAKDFKATLYDQNNITISAATADYNENLIHLSGDVKITLDGGDRTLSCSRAFVDIQKFTGTFSSLEGEEKVIYQQNKLLDNRQLKPLMIKSYFMEARLVKNVNDLQLLDMVANDDVLVDYNGEFLTHSDFLTYTPDVEPILTLDVEKNEGSCELKDNLGNFIQGERIEVNKKDQLLTCYNGVGAFSEANELLNFSAKKIIWDNAAHMIKLNEEASVSHKEYGNLKTTKNLWLTFNQEKALPSTHVSSKNVVTSLNEGSEKRGLHFIEADGASVLTHNDSKSPIPQTIKCYGTLKVDHKKMESILKSPKDPSGHVIEKFQVVFNDSKGEIFADKVFIKYELIDSKVTPVRLVLQGNVKITNNLNSSVHDLDLVKQYIMADNVEFFPQTNEMILKGNKNQRVLLFDNENDLQLSAPGLKITRDSRVKKESVLGMGDVRLSFIQSEWDKIMGCFNFGSKDYIQK